MQDPASMAAPRSILDEARARLPVAGRVRTGIKVLTSAAKANAEAVRLYQDGLGRGASFDEIERLIRDRTGIDKPPLVPRNTPYFRVSRRDFTMPELADRIMDLYAEDRGEGRQLYRFPVVFPFDSWLENMPHGMRAYASSGLKFWSEYDAAGKRFCMTYAPAQAASPANRRAQRTWGGRQHVLREDNGGACAPAQCGEYQCGGCKLTGRLLFHIPGIPGASLIELDTTSFYSMQQMRAQMELVARIRNGRLSGVHNGRPIFYLAKTQEEVSRLENGQPKKVQQYLVRLEADIDMTEVYARQEALALPAASRAVAALTGTTAADSVMDVGAETVDQAEQPVSDPPPDPAAVSPDDDALKAARRRVYALIRQAGQPEAEVIERLDRQFGAGWGGSLDKLREVETDLAFGG